MVTETKTPVPQIFIDAFKDDDDEENDDKCCAEYTNVPREPDMACICPCHD